MAIRPRPGGWQAEVYQGPTVINGKRVNRVKAKTFRLKKDAEKWEREQKDSLQRGTYREPSEMTLDQYLDQWLEGSRTSVRQRTHNDYERMLRGYIRPHLGHVRLEALTTPMIRTAYAKLLETRIGKPPAEGEDERRTLSPRTVRYAHSVLRLALGMAADDGLIRSNPARAKKLLPMMKREEQRVLSREQAVKLLSATKSERTGALWNLLVRTGLRPGEALALKWRDLRDSKVKVQRTLCPTTKDDAGKWWRLEEPKTAKSRRTVELHPETVEALEFHRGLQQVDKETAGEGYTDEGFIFASPTGQPLRQDVLYKGDFKRACTAAGVPYVRMYDLRHTAATLMLEAGVPLKVVSEQLGHASITMTADVYTHVSSSMQVQAAEALARYMAEP